MSIPHHSTHITQLTALLSAGVSQVDAASRLGITPSAVTQLIETSPDLQELRRKQLERSSQLDIEYDEIEAKLLQQLKRVLPLVMKPGEIGNLLTRINAARRRGVAASTNEGPTTIVQLNLPTAIQNKFVVNTANQVVAAGSQELVTIPSQAVQTLLKRKELPHAPTIPTPTILEEDEFGFTHTRKATGS